MLARDFLEISAARLPEKVALVCGNQRFTYATLDAQADRLAQALLAHGVRHGDRVVIHLPNGLAAVVGIFAALKAGAVFVPVNPTAKAEKLGFILNNCRAAALLTGINSSLLPAGPCLKVVVNCGSSNRRDPACLKQNGAAAILDFETVLAGSPSQRPRRTNSPDDLACLIYTSGSTGKPKGVMCEHRSVVFVSDSIIQYLQNSGTDIILCVLPFSFGYGLYQLLMTFRFGGTLVLENSFAFPSVILQRITDERVTGLAGVPTLFSLLLACDLEPYDVSSVRYLTNAAAALHHSHIQQLRRKFPRARFYSMYGLTETKRALYLPPEELDRRPGSVGIPIPGTEAWIEDDLGRRLAPGKVGELVIQGPHVMRGYWEDPDRTALRFRPGPEPGERICYSGDLFRQDADGFFYFVARKDDIIKSRGEKIAPKEVEEVLYALPGVTEAAVIGVPDPLLGQSVKAFLVCRGNPLGSARVMAHCRARLEDFMVPREVEFLKSLPKNASGKIDKLALARPAQVPDGSSPFCPDDDSRSFSGTTPDPETDTGLQFVESYETPGNA